jgi:hypothetical protein
MAAGHGYPTILDLGDDAAALEILGCQPLAFFPDVGLIAPAHDLSDLAGDPSADGGSLIDAVGQGDAPLLVARRANPSAG